jgi:hypothetical protein
VHVNTQVKYVCRKCVTFEEMKQLASHHRARGEDIFANMLLALKAEKQSQTEFKTTYVTLASRNKECFDLILRSGPFVFSYLYLIFSLGTELEMLNPIIVATGTIFSGLFGVGVATVAFLKGVDLPWVVSIGLLGTVFAMGSFAAVTGKPRQNVALGHNNSRASKARRYKAGPRPFLHDLIKRTVAPHERGFFFRLFNQKNPTCFKFPTMCCFRFSKSYISVCENRNNV